MPSNTTLSTSTSVLQISVIGGARFVYDGREIGLRSRKGRAMLAYIALNGSPEVDRDRLAGLLWSDSGQNDARTALRQAVSQVRQAMEAAGCESMTTSRNTVGLKPGSYQLDLDPLLAAIRSREAPEALLQQERLSETLLAGFEGEDPSFDGWLTARRRSLEDLLIRELEEGYRDMAVPRRRRRRLAEAVLRLDPTHEAACRVVMRAAAEDSETSAALRTYDELYRLLDDEQGTEPAAETQALVAEIKLGKVAASPERTQPNGSRRDDGVVRRPQGLADSAQAPLSYEAEMRQVLLPQHRVARPMAAGSISAKPALLIEPFAMSGVSADDAHLVEGFRNELIACLARFREWYVIGADGDLQDEHGGVPVSSRYAVATTAYHAGSIINVVMVLRERPLDLAVWGERFELRLDRWFETQQFIIRRIAATLNVQLSDQRLMRLSHVPTTSLEAYDIWLRGQVAINEYTAGDWNRTAEMLAWAIEREPGFSPLYSSLAQMNNVVHYVQPGKFRDEYHVQRTLMLAQRAVALDPRDSRAHLCLGWALAFARRYSQAELHMDIASELNSTDSHTLMSSAMFHGFNGDIERAAKQAAMSLEMALQPTLTHWRFLTNICFLHGDYAGTLVAAERAQDGLPTMLALRAAALSALGRTEEAAQDLGRFYAKVRAAWAGDAPPTEELVAQWLLHLYPISRVEIWQRLRDGMALAGIPVVGLTYHGRSG
jgi:DNA-binding SARP family transcriptional activator/TolB-like protein